MCDRHCSSTLRTASHPLACSVCLPNAANTAVLPFENCAVLTFHLCCIFSCVLVAPANMARAVWPVLCPLQVFSLLRKLGSSEKESTALYTLLPGTFCADKFDFSLRYFSSPRNTLFLFTTGNASVTASV